MNIDSLHNFYAAFAPWLALSLLFLGRNPHPQPPRIIVSLLLSAAILFVPFQGFPIARWIALLEPNPSITLTALLSIALIARVGGPRLFRPQEWRTAWLFGSAASLILYPMGLGLTKYDSYTWGWSPVLAIATAATATVLLITANRFGVVLLLALLGMVIHPIESTNAWDSLVDPCYGIFSLSASLFLLISYRISIGHSGSARRNALP